MSCNNAERASTWVGAMHQGALPSTCQGSGSVLVYFLGSFGAIYNLTDGIIKECP